jgi:hypothetical protein
MARKRRVFYRSANFFATPIDMYQLVSILHANDRSAWWRSSTTVAISGHEETPNFQNLISIRAI